MRGMEGGMIGDVVRRLADMVDEEAAKACEACRKDMAGRLMPEGMEWLVDVWPRFEDGEPVRFLDDFERYGEENGVSAVTMYADGSFTLNCRAYSKGERVNRPAPKALDAEGNRIEPAMDVWWVCEDDERGVLAEKLHVESIGEDGLVECSPYNGGTWVYLEPSELYVNRPVLAADGKPLEVGQTVWRDDGERLEVLYLRPDGLVDCCGEIERPERLTHERPES